MNDFTIEDLLSKCNLSDKYLATFTKECITFERFEQLVRLNPSFPTSNLFDRLGLACGDYIAMLTALD